MTTITITVLGKQEVIAKYAGAGATLATALNETMKTQMVRLADYVRANKLSGDPLNRRTGKLSRSITGQSRINGQSVIGQIGSKGVPYAFVHEYGGVFEIREHTRRTGFNERMERIRLLNKANSVRAAVRSMTRGTVRAHTATYPQRAFLHPSMEENKSVIIAALKQSVLDALHAT